MVSDCFDPTSLERVIDLLMEPFLPSRIATNRQQNEPKALTPAEREARRIFAGQEAQKALSEYEAAKLTFNANRERLKAERLAREAAASKTSFLAIQDG